MSKIKNIVIIPLFLSLLSTPVKGNEKLTPPVVSPAIYGSQEWFGTYTQLMFYRDSVCDIEGVDSILCERAFSEYFRWMDSTESSINSKKEWIVYLTLVCNYADKPFSVTAPVDCKRASEKYLNWLKKSL
ncbi:hypothetical protein [Nostoc sp. FACHB-280]|uniref:hypothetical protein n=1 Tax=Nostoc sp. FACHB-280 TaxID=2692839 RepID=UPI00168BA6E7|nr:hypothetical protein [Nostoc sp. FACHB-280]MBD2493548.1 hypothetical protein [Nostoc sp. FACHB-280]